MQQQKPCTVRHNAIVVEGGCLAEPWVVDTMCIEGVEYISVCYSDRKLAKALGMNASERAPLSDVTLISRMEKERDDRID